MSRRSIAYLAGLVLLAFLLRVIGLQNRGIWYDDAFSIFLSEQSFGNIVKGTAADTMPPLYYFLLHFWMSFGSQLWFLRLLNVILSVAIVGFVYVLGRELFSDSVGLLGAFFTAISPLQIYHAQELRMYVILTLALLGYIWFFVRLWKKRGLDFEPLSNPSNQNFDGDLSSPVIRNIWPDWLGLIVFGVVAMYSHNLAVFTLVAPAFFVALKKRWRFMGALLVAQFIIGLFSLPWLAQVPGQVAKIQAAFWTPRPGLVEIIQAFTTFHSNLPLPSWLLPVAIILSLQILIMVLFETFKRGWREESLLFTFVVILVPPILMFVGSYVMRPIFIPRAMMLSSLVYYLLLARAIAQGRSQGIGLFLVGVFTVLALLALPYQYSYDAFPRSPFKTMTTNLSGQVGPKDIILHDNKLSFFPSKFYAPDLPQTFLPDQPGSHNDSFAPDSQQAMGIYPVSSLQAAIQNRSKIWFIVFTQAIEEYRQAGIQEHPVIADLESKFKLVGKQSFNDLIVYEFAR